MMVRLRIARVRKPVIIIRYGSDVRRGEGISGACCMCLGVCHQIDLPVRLTDFVIDGIGSGGSNHLIHGTVGIIQTMRQGAFVMGCNSLGNLGGGCAATNGPPVSAGIGFVLRKSGKRPGYIAAKLFLGGRKRICPLIQFIGDILHRGLHVGDFVFGHCHPLFAGLAGL